MYSISYFYSHPQDAVNVFLLRLCRWMPDKLYLKIQFRSRMGYKLNLQQPRTFAEKLQWLKLYDRKPIYHQMVDKVECKQLIANIMGGVHDTNPRCL